MEKKNLKENTYLRFTLIFTLIAFLCYIQFLIYGKSFLVHDGLHEHTAFLAFYGGWLREIVSGFLHGNFRIPTFSFSLGLGADVISTLNWFCVGDPLNLLSIFFPKSAAYFLFVLLAFLRLYLIGCSFIFYCGKHSFQKQASIIGAAAYSFCGYAIFVGLRHPYFLNPMIYLPLLCFGIDRILEKNKPLFFTIMVFVACACNYYFFYMLSIFIFIYALVRFFFTAETINVKSFLQTFFRTAGFYFLGVALAAFIFIPNIYGFLTASRTTASVDVPFFYDLNYYANLFFSPVSPSSFGSYGTMGFAAPLLLTSILVFSFKDKISLQLKIFLSIGIVFFCVPFLAHITNGFNYITNRWCFAFAFPVCISFVHVFSKLNGISKKNASIPVLLVLVQNLIILAACSVNSNIRQQYLACYLFSLVFIFTFYILIDRKKNTSCFIFICVLLGIVINANVRLSPYGLNYLEKYLESGVYSKNFNSNTDIEILKLADKDFFRYDEENKFSSNNSVVFGTHGTNYYYSTPNIHLIELYEEMALAPTSDMTCRSLNRRTELQSLFNARYFVLPEEKKYVPENMTFIKEFETYGGKKRLYKLNEENLFATSYQKIIRAENNSFRELTPLEKQQIFTEAAVIYGSEQISTQETPLEDFDLYKKIHKKNVSISCSDGIKIDGKTISVLKKGAVLEIDFSDIENFNSKSREELYILLKNFRYKTDKSEKAGCTVSLETFSGNEEISFSFTSDNDTVGHTKMPCFGIQTSESGTIHIFFEKNGKYEFDGIEVYSLPIFSVEATNSEKNIVNTDSFSTNSISLTAYMKEPAFIRFSLPYSKGWKIFIDGKKAETYRCNAAFLGTFIDSGKHSVVLKYHTPFLFVGGAISLAALATVILFMTVFRRKKSDE